MGRLVSPVAVAWCGLDLAFCTVDLRWPDSTRASWLHYRLEAEDVPGGAVPMLGSDFSARIQVTLALGGRISMQDAGPLR